MNPVSEEGQTVERRENRKGEKKCVAVFPVLI